tara:strand:+ start:1292 stop:1573 length:282 start_codon:yes stop_codon:yes gene_type:complete
MEEKEIDKLAVKIDRLYDALMGDKLNRKIGYFDQIELNTVDIKKNADEIEKIKIKDRTPWGKIGVASSAGLGLGGIGATKGGAVITKIMELFT